MKVLIGCESSGAVRRAFRAHGHDAWSCDLLPADDGDKHHIHGDLLELLREHRRWDLAVFHPPCTFLSSSGLHWNTRDTDEGRERAGKTKAALRFVRHLLFDFDIPKIALENPVGCISTKIKPASQYVQPFQFGHKESKNTGLWLKGLPLLQATKLEVADWCCEDGTRFPLSSGGGAAQPAAGNGQLASAGRIRPTRGRTSTAHRRTDGRSAQRPTTESQMRWPFNGGPARSTKSFVEGRFRSSDRAPLHQNGAIQMSNCAPGI